MSGHSKWANIKRKKEANDKVKGAVFAKMSRLITLAVVEGGGMPDPSHNFKLRLAIDKARSMNMPKENINRAIEKASGADRNSIKEIIYEGFAPHGVALMIQATSDNPNRTVSEIKNVIEMHGGKIGSQGSVAYLFNKCALIEFDTTINKEEDILNFSEALNAIDIEQEKLEYYVYVPFEQYGKIKEALGPLQPKNTEVDYKPLSPVEVGDTSSIDKIVELIQALEDLDDVHHVYSNLSMPEGYEMKS